MYRFVRSALEGLGIPRRSIRQEVIPEDPTQFAGWPKNVSSDILYTITLTDGRSFRACAADTILQALEKNGIVVHNSCRSGECSTCRTKLVDGKVFHPGTEMLRKADMRFGYIHPCVTYPISDITLLIS